MKYIQENAWSFLSVRYGAYVALALTILQSVSDAQVLPANYQSILSMVLVLGGVWYGKKKYQPELHPPQLAEYAIQPVAQLSTPVQQTGDLVWMIEAKKYIGLRENTSKTAHNPTILSWLKSLGAWWSEDETPWCGVFVAHCLMVAGVKYPTHWYRALAYLDGGTKLELPAYGCVAVKTRAGGGHVCFVVGQTAKGDLVCLGGNQNNMVSYAIYKKGDFEQFRWYGKTSRPADSRYNLPIIRSVTSTKVTEA